MVWNGVVDELGFTLGLPTFFVSMLDPTNPNCPKWACSKCQKLCGRHELAPIPSAAQGH